MKVSAKTIIDAFEENELRADQLYRGKLVEVAGVFSKAGRDVFTGTPYVEIGTGAALEILHVHCAAAPGQEPTVAGMKAGQRVYARGRVVEKLVFVQIEGCTFHRSSSPSVSAKSICERLEAARVATRCTPGELTNGDAYRFKLEATQGEGCVIGAYGERVHFDEVLAAAKDKPTVASERALAVVVCSDVPSALLSRIRPIVEAL